ncbi:DMT family transporter [Thermosediminibacter litoriperuensis]|uniref:Drug/metabolite transporter (DMT)-like permease n=1 Tax=Thermosediminibacter litoriperuensis TaxID=291989 RepID=A0A5S5ASM6_9FIRM|nr:DMT family transporter [Thermosediminibacter litoriperuensis]TYP54209.1 drug/metabolite transporter (DMT)-like permease [Thermosediminibacter litoriperuensis]
MNLDKAKGYLAGVGFSSIFGFSFMFTKNALERVDPFRFIGFRFALAAFTIGLLAATGVIRFSLRGRRLAPLLAVAFLQPVCYFTFETMGVNLTSSSQAGMMMALIPIFVAILSALMLKERPSPAQTFFIILSVSGVIIIAAFQGVNGGEANLHGLLFLTGAVLSAAFYNIASRRFSAEYTPFEVTFVMMWVGALFFNTVAFILHLKSGNPGTFLAPLADGRVLVSLFYLGIGSSVIAFFLVNYSLSRLPASQSAVFSNLTTVISVLAGVIFRGEPFFWYQAAGALLILAGVWGTNHFAELAEEKQKNLREGGKISK